MPTMTRAGYTPPKAEPKKPLKKAQPPKKKKRKKKKNYHMLQQPHSWALEKIYALHCSLQHFYNSQDMEAT